MAWTGSRGVSMVEATIVLTAIAVLSAVTAPAASRIVNRARVARAIDDAEAIKTAIINYREDVSQGFSTNGVSNGPNMDMLVSDGDTPSTSLSDDNGALPGAEMRWDDPVDADGPGIITDFLEGHLVTNRIFNGAASYPTSGQSRWRGAYLNAPIDADPWGNRYAVNVRFLRAPSNTRNDTIVLSAGPDEEIDTLFEKDGIYPGDDDIIVVVLRTRNRIVP